MSDTAFQPDWATPPGATIADALKARGISVNAFAPRIGATHSEAQALISGEIALTEDTARRLASELGATVAFWLMRESRYQNALLRISGVAAEDGAAWLKSLPLRDMQHFGWVGDSRDPLGACLRFFGVADVAAWKREILPLIESFAFRTSPSFTSSAGAVATWLRQGQIESESIECEPWHANSFHNALQEIRGLTRNHNPEVFLPALQAICARCGVAVSVLRAPTGCRASGATRFLTSKKAMLLLSFRYLSDDHFWFSFFHEAGHLLLHAPKSLFLEGLEGAPDQRENEANQFAEDLLIPTQFRSELRDAAARDFRFIIRIAKQIGIAPGIVVGQLQHWGWIGRNRFNMLKRRFRWEP